MAGAYPARRIVALDGVRAVAIVLVLIDHEILSRSSARAWLASFADATGSLGVNIFFVLSGFLITSLLLDERRRSGRIDLRAFMLRRTRRIFPAYYAFLALLALAGAAGIGVHIAPLAFVFDALYLRNYAFFVPRDWWTAHVWSLCIEEQFYLFWPATLVALRGTTGIAFAVACVVLAPILRAIAYVAFPHHRDDISIMLPTRVDLLMSGAVLALVRERVALAERIFAPFRRRGAVAAAIAVLALGIVLEARYRGLYALTVGYSLTGLAVATILLHVVERPQAALARSLSSGPVVWLGRISYSLYLWQQPFFGPTPLGRSPLNIVAAVAVAAASYYLIERRFLRSAAAPLEARATVS
ncbi:MAG: hypothetical protein NVSMB19_14320 [Vulcanimicrobiaceae bacterium]